MNSLQTLALGVLMRTKTVEATLPAKSLREIEVVDSVICHDYPSGTCLLSFGYWQTSHQADNFQFVHPLVSTCMNHLLHT